MAGPADEAKSLMAQGKYADALQKLADLQLALGNPSAAADALDRLMYVNPFDIALHQKLADKLGLAG